MSLLQIAVLALVQALSEFLPISSSAHLALVPVVVPGWSDQGLVFDVAVHMGTLIAVLAYFHRDVASIGRAWLASLMSKERRCAESDLAWGIIFASVPIAVAGLVLHDLIEHEVRDWRLHVIATTTICFGILLGLADRRGSGSRNERQLSWKELILIGCAQALAVFPGTSRSGVTMTAGRFLGLERRAAARISFLLSIPAMLMAGSYMALQLARDSTSIPARDMILGIALTAAAGYACIHVFLRALARIGLWPFVVYRLLLGAALVAMILLGGASAGA